MEVIYLRSFEQSRGPDYLKPICTSICYWYSIIAGEKPVACSAKLQVCMAMAYDIQLAMTNFSAYTRGAKLSSILSLLQVELIHNNLKVMLEELYREQ